MDLKTLDEKVTTLLEAHRGICHDGHRKLLLETIASNHLLAETILEFSVQTAQAGTMDTAAAKDLLFEVFEILTELDVGSDNLVDETTREVNERFLADQMEEHGHGGI